MTWAIMAVVAALLWSIVPGSMGVTSAQEPSAAAVRTLRARHAPTDRWAQRVDTSLTKPAARFAEEVAQQFGVGPGEILVIESWVTEPERERMVREMAQGLHEGRAVWMAPPVPPTQSNPAQLGRRTLPGSPGRGAPDAFLEVTLPDGTTGYVPVHR